ncbi:MAG: DNA-directed RNA polymerase subunit alpha [Candidatus Portnoybacteria bacterium CG23_combo_of_CG06-09_8_20_14_all_37_13]|uniref:DNA-directed RNA polymerase subunit alpha n=1 Tax=Candidatus Portnoybacteria bacterium CG23_combo_of_CG06-09_8_20_14_all_37_13 TaxID=1974819 RepID=A0A2G9YDC6_9BACT|nr:MAG: DNA-directed RNA polymerase subunit alpha [Candidatus Portnoybacteria bacterium CG23_combo_of_CG06-09_8_20_14_all_37_13]
MNQKIALPLKPKIIEQKNHQALFEIAPCHPGYGITIGNSLRRVLLSSLGGAAITSIKVAGVNHEFSTIPHVMEDVVEIMLNIKQLRLKLYSDEPVKIFLKAQGEGAIKAKDIKATSSVEIINKDLHIATLTDKKANLEIEMLVENGLGYLPAEQQAKDKSEIGLISLDAIFTPIRRVNFTVENMRVGKRTDFDRLILDIETDGTVSPKEALVSAAQLLVKHFKIFTKIEVVKKTKIKKQEKVVKKTKPKTKPEKNSLQEILVDDLKISSRTITVLRENRIKSVANLAKKSEEQLLEIGGMGEKSVKEIKRELGKLGIILKNE